MIRLVTYLERQAAQRPDERGRMMEETPMNEPIVRLEGINKWFGKLHVLRDINLEI